MAIVGGPLSYEHADIPAPARRCCNCGSTMVGYRWKANALRCQWDCQACGAESIHSLPLPADRVQAFADSLGAEVVIKLGEPGALNATEILSLGQWFDHERGPGAHPKD